MIKIVALGGGEIGRPGFKIETTKIDREIIALTGKKRPRLLFIPTASSDSPRYFELIKKYFGEKLGCRPDVLYLIKDQSSRKEIEQKIFNTDIVYVGGGNTLKMMNVWRRLGVDKILRQAAAKGVVLAGLSAGSICWFRYGNSDSRKFKNPSAGLIKVSGLGMINALHCPHYDIETSRRADLKKMMKKTPGIAIALDNCCALEVLGDNYRIISSQPRASAYKVYWSSNKYHEELIKSEKTFKSLAALLSKK